MNLMKKITKDYIKINHNEEPRTFIEQVNKYIFVTNELGIDLK